MLQRPPTVQQEGTPPIQPGVLFESLQPGVQSVGQKRLPSIQLQPPEEEPPEEEVLPEELMQIIFELQRLLELQHNNAPPVHLIVLSESRQPGLLQFEGQMILLPESQ